MISSLQRLGGEAGPRCGGFHLSLQLAQVSAVEAQLCTHAVSVRSGGGTELLLHPL